VGFPFALIVMVGLDGQQRVTQRVSGQAGRVNGGQRHWLSKG